MQKEIFERVDVECPSCGYLVSVEGGADKCPSCDTVLKVNATENKNQIGLPDNQIVVEEQDPNQPFLF